jgi:large subunit ribosomal protein L29
MNIKELREKKKEDLEKMLLELTQKIQDLNFKDANKQLKNVREIRVIKKTIARIKTLLMEIK